MSVRQKETYPLFLPSLHNLSILRLHTVQTAALDGVESFNTDISITKFGDTNENQEIRENIRTQATKTPGPTDFVIALTVHHCREASARTAIARALGDALMKTLLGRKTVLVTPLENPIFTGHVNECIPDMTSTHMVWYTLGEEQQEALKSLLAVFSTTDGMLIKEWVTKTFNAPEFFQIDGSSFYFASDNKEIFTIIPGNYFTSLSFIWKEQVVSESAAAAGKRKARPGGPGPGGGGRARSGGGPSGGGSSGGGSSGGGPSGGDPSGGDPSGGDAMTD